MKPKKRKNLDFQYSIVNDNTYIRIYEIHDFHFQTKMNNSDERKSYSPFLLLTGMAKKQKRTNTRIHYHLIHNGLLP